MVGTFLADFLPGAVQMQAVYPASACPGQPYKDGSDGIASVVASRPG